MLHRRRFLQSSTLATTWLGMSAYYTVPGLFAAELTKTPRQTEGPFYPDKMPLDTDNDLLIVNSSITPAVGTIVHLTGRVVDVNGKPLRNATVEIWQVDNNGSYLHSKSGNREKLDKNFQGFGRCMTGKNGEYQFRTIKPVPYPGRTPHIHVAVKAQGQQTFVTQCYIKGEPQNDRDGVLRGIRDEAARNSVIIDFAPIAESKIGELAAHFEIVPGWTPAG